MTYFAHKGKEYTSLEAMPPDVQKAYAKWRQEQNLPDDLLEFYEEELRQTEAQNREELPLPSTGWSGCPPTAPIAADRYTAIV
jgi:hypothetical protein